MAYVTSAGPPGQELAGFVRAVMGDAPDGLRPEIADSMPMTPSGKISTAQLARRAAPKG